MISPHSLPLDAQGGIEGGLESRCFLNYDRDDLVLVVESFSLIDRLRLSTQ